jgi:hypothetical protein
VTNDGDDACYYCHLSDDCVGCHTRHVHPGGAVSSGSGGSQ